MLNTIFSYERKENDIFLFLNTTGEVIQHDVDDLYALLGFYNTDKEQLFIAGDDNGGETFGFCVPLDDVSFQWNDEEISLKEARKIIKKG
jgi:hypothetical protein